MAATLKTIRIWTPQATKISPPGGALLLLLAGLAPYVNVLRSTIRSFDFQRLALGSFGELMPVLIVFSLFTVCRKTSASILAILFWMFPFQKVTIDI